MWTKAGWLATEAVVWPGQLNDGFYGGGGGCYVCMCVVYSGCVASKPMTLSMIIPSRLIILSM